MSCYAGPGVGAPDLLGFSPSHHTASLEGLVVCAWGVQEQLEQKPLPFIKLFRGIWETVTVCKLGRADKN